MARLRTKHYVPARASRQGKLIIPYDSSVITGKHNGYIAFNPLSLPILYLLNCNHASTFPISHTEASICQPAKSSIARLASFRYRRSRNLLLRRSSPLDLALFLHQFLSLLVLPHFVKLRTRKKKTMTQDGPPPLQKKRPIT